MSVSAGWGGAAAWCLCNSPALCSPLSIQIKEKLLQLTEKRKEMIDKWEDRWEWLRLSKDTLGFLLGWAVSNSLLWAFLGNEKNLQLLTFLLQCLEVCLCWNSCKVHTCVLLNNGEFETKKHAPKVLLYMIKFGARCSSSAVFCRCHIPTSMLKSVGHSRLEQK